MPRTHHQLRFDVLDVRARIADHPVTALLGQPGERVLQVKVGNESFENGWMLDGASRN
jgi:hypothetical protein